MLTVLEHELIRLTLHVYEKVELELGPLLPGPDSVFRCPVRLFLDPSCPLRYLASHSAGLHQVKKVEVLLAGELFQENQDLPQPYTKCCVFSGTSCR